MGFVASVCQPSILRMLIWPEASSAQHRRGICRWQHCLRLDPSFELLVQPFDGISGARRAPLARWQAGESKQPVTRFLQTVGDRPALQPPLSRPLRMNALRRSSTAFGVAA